MKIKILQSATNDLLEGYWFYESQEETLGNYFYTSLFKDIDSLLLYHGIHIKEMNYYKMLSKKFPYAIYYKINVDIIEIFAILDCRRDPDWINDKLRSV